MYGSFDQFDVHPNLILGPMAGVSAPRGVFPYPFLRTPVADINNGVTPGNPRIQIASFRGQAGRLAANTFYRYAESQGMNNPAQDQIEAGYTQPLQQFVNPQPLVPQPTDPGSKQTAGIKHPVPTQGIATAMPWQVI